MNIKYIVSMALCLCWALSYAQLPPCINQFNILTTDWRVSPQTTNGSQVNTWDWTRDRFAGDVWIIENSVGNPPVCTDIPAPWHSSQINNPNVSNLVNDYQFVLGNRLDIYPNNGWELLTKNMGRLITDPQGNQVPEPVANPSFSLYNRRTGQIRFFLYITYTTFASPRAANVRLKYKKNVFGVDVDGHLLNHRDEVLVPLEKFKQDEVQDGQAEYNGTPRLHWACDGKGYWIYADFWTNLDVCACENLYPASVEFDFQMIENSSIQMKIDGDITGSIVQSQYGTQTYLDNSSFLQKGFKGIMGLQSLAQTGVEGFSKSYKAISEFDQLLVKIAGKQKTSAAAKIVAKGKFFGPKGMLAFAGLGMINHFIKQGKKDYTEQQVAQNRPLDFEANFNVNLVANGTVTSNPQGIQTLMYVPGSPLQPAGYNTAKPLYNNVLGVFSVLSIPKLQWVKYQYPVLSNIHPPHNTVSDVYQYKLGDEQINYYVNPASGLKIKSIRTQLIYKIKDGGNMNFGFPVPPYFYQPPYTGFFQFGNTEYEHCEGVDVLEKQMNASGIEVVNRTVDAISVSEMYFGLPFSPITCVHDQTILAGHGPQDIEVSLKFHVIFEVETNFASPDPIGGEYPPPTDGSNEVEYVVTYKVDVDEAPLDNQERQMCALIKGLHTNEYEQVCNIDDLYQHVLRNHGQTNGYNSEYRNGLLFKRMSPSPWPKIDAMEQLPVSLIIENTVLNGSQHIKAIRNIEVGSNVTVTPGSAIHLQAGEQIVINAENTLNPEFKGEIGFVPASVPGFCNRTYTPVNLTPFCTSGSSYYTRAMSKRAAGVPDEESGETVNTPHPATTIQATVQPNPASHTGLYQFVLTEEDYVQADLVSVSGDNIKTLVGKRYFPAGKFERMIDVSNLPPGVYFIRLTTDKGHVANTRLVVLR